MKNTLRKFLIIFIIFSIILNFNFVCNAVDENVQVDEDMVDSYSDESNDEIEGISLDEDSLVDTTEDESDSDNSTDDEEYVEDEDYSDEEDEEDYEDEESYSNTNQFNFSSKDITISDNSITDVFIFSAGNVTIDSSIYGNVFVVASNVNITENADISASVFCVSNTLTIDGSIEGSVYSVSKNFTLNENAYIGTDLFLTCNVPNINGSIERNANISSGDIIFSESAEISGDLNYTADKEVSIPENVVKGNVNYTKYQNEDNKTPISQYIFDFIAFIVVAIILYVIFKFLKAKFIGESKEEFTSNLPKYILYGILGLIVPPIVFIILLMLNVTTALAFILLALYIIFMMIASSVTIIVLSQLIVEQLKDKIKLNDTAKIIISIIVLSIIYKLLKLIPTIGFIITLATVVIGLGIVIKDFIPVKDN